MRETIFDLISKDIDFYTEAKNIETLFLREIVNYYDEEMSIEEFVSNFLFLDWEYRDTFINLYIFKEHLGIEDINVLKNKNNLKIFLSYLEYILNIVTLFSYKSFYSDDIESLNIFVKPIIINIKRVLEKINHKYYFLDEDKIKIIIIESREDVSAVVEKIDDENLSLDLIKYNHYELKGNISEKIKILTQAYKIFEEIKYKLKDDKFGVFQNDLSGLFNNLGIRHTTNKDKNKEIHNRVNNMSNEELEMWCDRTYDMFLTAVLLCDYIDFKPEITVLNEKSNKE